MFRMIQLLSDRRYSPRWVLQFAGLESLVKASTLPDHIAGARIGTFSVAFSGSGS